MHPNSLQTYGAGLLQSMGTAPEHEALDACTHATLNACCLALVCSSSACCGCTPCSSTWPGSAAGQTSTPIRKAGGWPSAESPLPRPSWWQVGQWPCWLTTIMAKRSFPDVCSQRTYMSLDSTLAYQPLWHMSACC